MSDCLFCKIREGEIPADIVFENDDVLAFNDVNPQAPVHVLIIPKHHISTVNDVIEDDQVLAAVVVEVAARVARAVAARERAARAQRAAPREAVHARGRLCHPIDRELERAN